MSPDSVVLSIQLLFAGLIVLGVILYMIRPTVRMLRKKPDADLLNTGYTSLMDEDQELEIPSEEEDGKPDRAHIIQQAKEDPTATAALVRNWLREKR